MPNWKKKTIKARRQRHTHGPRSLPVLCRAVWIWETPLIPWDGNMVGRGCWRGWWFRCCGVLLLLPPPGLRGAEWIECREWIECVGVWLGVRWCGSSGGGVCMVECVGVCVGVGGWWRWWIGVVGGGGVCGVVVVVAVVVLRRAGFQVIGVQGWVVLQQPHNPRRGRPGW